MGVEYPGPTGLFSHGVPGDLFELWLGHLVLPALCCLPLVLPLTGTVTLGCRWLLPSRNTLLIYIVTCLHPLDGILDLAHHARGCQCSPGPALLRQIHITGQVVFTQFTKTLEKKFPFAI